MVATACALHRPPSVSCKVICRWLLLVLDLEVPRRGQAANQGQLQPVLVWGHLARVTGHAEARSCLFAVCESLRDFRKVCSTRQGRWFVWKSHW